MPFAPFVVMTVGLTMLVARYSLWRDEAFTARQAHESFSDLLRSLWRTHSSDAAQPLYYLLLWPWQRLVGNGEAALRLPSLAMMVVASLVLFLAGRRLRPTLPASCFGLLLSMPVIVWYSIEARAYALIILLVSMHLLESVRLLKGASRTPVALAAVTFLVAAAYTVAGCAAVLAFVLVVRQWHRSPSGARGQADGGPHHQLTRATVGVLAGILLATLVLIGFSVTRASEAAGPEARSPAVSVAYVGYELVLGRSVGFSVRELRATSASALAREQAASVLVVGVVALVLVVVSGLAIRDLARRPAWPDALLVLPWALVGVGFVGYSLLADLPLLGRHLLFVVPSVYLVLSLGMATPSRRSVGATAAVLWAIGFLALGGMGLSHRYDKEDFRGVVRILERCGLAPQGVALAAPRDGMQYYNRDFASVQELDVDQAMALVVSGAKEAAVVDTNHVDPKGLRSAEIVRQAGLMTLARTDFRIVTRRSIEECGGGAVSS